MKAVTLLALRLCTGLYLLAWGAVKFANPERAIDISDKFYGGQFNNPVAQLALGAVAGVIGIFVILGFLRAFSYAAQAVILGFSAAAVGKSVFQPLVGHFEVTALIDAATVFVPSLAFFAVSLLPFVFWKEDFVALDLDEIGDLEKRNAPEAAPAMAAAASAAEAHAEEHAPHEAQHEEHVAAGEAHADEATVEEAHEAEGEPVHDEPAHDEPAAEAHAEAAHAEPEPVAEAPAQEAPSEDMHAAEPEVAEAHDDGHEVHGEAHESHGEEGPAHGDGHAEEADREHVAHAAHGGERHEAHAAH